MSLSGIIENLNNSFHKQIFFTTDIPPEAKDNVFSELAAVSNHNKLRVDALADLRKEFNTMTKQELINHLVLTQDKLSEVSYELKNEKDAFERAIKGMVNFSRKYSDLHCEICGLGYVKCDKCGKWKKR